ncbi:class I SAM-dependent methyltransferase [Streptosporangium sp. NPDC001559]|uniref:class I SAM-dependent methyltransferase n=1 Tax=Streptosporangium sp. NPDC001559 TaxID=3366187 RepID=UPI0036E7E2FF
MTTTSFYDGLLGTVYANAIADQRFVEDDVFTQLVAGADGPALELGSGTGRLMLRLLAAGHDVEGLEISDEMTDVCVTEGSRLGLRPVVHRGSFAPLDASLRGYAVIFCPLNAFSFIVDDALAMTAVRSYAAALKPGGVLALAGSAGEDTLRDGTGWTRRPDVPVAEATLAQVEERRTPDADGRCLRIERIIRIVGPDGTVRRTQRGTQLRRLRPIAALAEMFADAGLDALHAYGTDADHILTGRKG